jgi:hypothetical protein
MNVVLQPEADPVLPLCSSSTQADLDLELKMTRGSLGAPPPVQKRWLATSPQAHENVPQKTPTTFLSLYG